MYLVITTYVVPMQAVEVQRAEHVEWVAKYVKNGTFIIAGPRRGQYGGVIVARTMDKVELDRILSEDSFVREGVVEVNVVDFDPMFAADDFREITNR